MKRTNNFLVNLREITFFIVIFFPIFSFSQLSQKEEGMLHEAVFFRINNLRQSLDLPSLIDHDKLQLAAKFHSDYMAKNSVLSHDEPKSKYANPQKRVLAFKGKEFEIVGENVLYVSVESYPLKKKDIVLLADRMVNAWVNSPPHYANMTQAEYDFGDLGFTIDRKNKNIYATHVFGKKGYSVPNQLSKNAFGLVSAKENECGKLYEDYSLWLLSIGNGVAIEGNQVMLYHHNIVFLKKLLSGPNDGFAIDLVSREQLACNHPNQLDFSPIYDGILLKPIFSKELFDGNSAEGDYRLITKVGDIPNELQGNKYSPSIVFIKNGKVCKNVYQTTIHSKPYDLLPFEPILVDDTTTSLVHYGVVRSEIVNYNFKTDDKNADDLPILDEKGGKVHSIVINSFSSVEGSSLRNEQLHNSRANTIKNHIISTLNIPSSSFTINAKENWEQMNFQLNYFHREDLAVLSHDSLKNILKFKDNSLPWDSLLYSQRRSVAIINYEGVFNEDLKEWQSFESFNLRTGVANNNVSLVNKALYEMYYLPDSNPFILFEPQVVEFIKTHPKTVANYAALLSQNYYFNPYSVAEFMHSWISRTELLDETARTNLVHLYTLVGSFLLDNWDVSAERLSNVIHPTKIEAISLQNVKPELVLNMQLCFIQYFGQINDYKNISKSFAFISNYFQNNDLSQEDDVNLALFFNYWTSYRSTVKHLLNRFQKNDSNEDGIFLLAEAMHVTNFIEPSGIYIDVNKKAIETNQVRWCEWINSDFQVKRNYEIKRLFCEACE